MSGKGIGKEGSARRSSGRQKVRLRVAKAFLVGCVALLALLSAQACAEREHSSLTDWLSEEVLDDEQVRSDPFGITFADARFELTGVSESGSTVGYFCALEPQETAQRVSGILRADGWRSLEADGVGGVEHPTILSFGRSEATDSPAFLFVQCVGVPGGSSVVVEVI
ncbi:MAG: hypothetical protein LBI64_05025 [Coriobacteriales bacterium]|jgi:hypothetical protein|nr:hypothetical protein [Coriobacteriales bacterium]